MDSTGLPLVGYLVSRSRIRRICLSLRVFASPIEDIMRTILLFLSATLFSYLIGFSLSAATSLLRFGILCFRSGEGEGDVIFVVLAC